VEIIRRVKFLPSSNVIGFMKPQSTLLFIFFFSSLYSYSQQDVEDVVGRDFRSGLNPSDEIPLFNKEEIKKRGFTTAYIVYHPASWFEDQPCSYNDTLAAYRFDNKGRIAEVTQFKTLGMFGTTFCYDTMGNWTKRISIRKYENNRVRRDTSLFDSKPNPNSKYLTIRQKTAGDSLITGIYFEKFETDFDTALVFIKRYDPKHRLIEEKDYATKKYTKMLGCSSDDFHHFKYQYDEKERLIYYRDMLSSTYSKISYPSYGKLTEIFHGKTQKLITTEPKFIAEDKGLFTISTKTRQITLVPLEKKSKLYKLKSIASSGEIPYMEYYEITYQ
jgi:hypothetical protein